MDNRFFDDLHTAFRSEPGPNGEPLADDFVRFDLFGIQDEVAHRFEQLPEEPTAPGVRTLLVSGLMVKHAAIYAAEMPDEIVYLIGLEVEHY